MFERSIFADLEAWSVSPIRKSLILRGARQVGKTTAVRMFSTRFDTYIELNLELSEDRAIFTKESDINRLYNLILVNKGIVSTGEKVLIFIDEIQNSSEAMLSLRYFYELMPHLYIIAAGSLLELYLNRERMGVSVGRVEYMWMYPLNFEEYIAATGNLALSGILNQIPIPEYALSTLRTHFLDYALIGGMPEAVKTFLETKDILAVRSVLENIINTYYDDVIKYARTSEQALTLRHIMETAYSEVGKQITFEGFGRSGIRSQAFKSAFAILEQTSLFTLLYPYTSTTLPCIPSRTKKPKLLVLDTGLLNQKAGVQEEYFGVSNLNTIYKGLAMEHLVGQQLLSLLHKYHYNLAFWVRNQRGSTAEIDYVITWKNMMIPIEVKSGKTGSLKSLYLFMEEANHPYAIRIYDGELNIQPLQTASGKGFFLLNLPLALTTKTIEYLEWMMSQYLQAKKSPE